MDNYNEKFDLILSKLAESEAKNEARFSEIKSQNAELKSQNAEIKSQNAEIKAQNEAIREQLNEVGNYVKLNTGILLSMISEDLPEEDIQAFNEAISNCQKTVESFPSEDAVSWTVVKIMFIIKDVHKNREKKPALLKALSNNTNREAWLWCWEQLGYPMDNRGIDQAEVLFSQEYGSLFPPEQFGNTNRIKGMRSQICKRTNEVFRYLFNVDSWGNQEIPDYPAFHELLRLTVEALFIYRQDTQDEIDRRVLVLDANGNVKSRADQNKLRKLRVNKLLRKFWLEKPEKFKIPA